MTKRTSPGRFSWHELVTSDVKDAVAFYGELFAWKTNEVDIGGMKYTLIKVGDTDIGGITTPMQGDPSPSHWNLYASVHDADAAVKRAKELGGKLLSPSIIDVPTVGRFAPVQDPQGAVLFVFESANDEKERDGKPANHTFCWDELLTSDPKAATAFYKGLFGYTVSDKDMGPMGTYHLLNRGDIQTAGIMKNPSPIAPHWITYVAVENVDATAKRVAPLKGKVLAQPMDIPGIGRFAVIGDRQGAAIAIFQGSM
jgi:predicted enzyme related to lactoylglutathione lyase